MTQESNVIIHVRFSPDGRVTEINERPEAITPQDWFRVLSLSGQASYQPLQGGRGVFRLARDDLAQLQL